jgi:hypothetical protein
MSVRLSPHRSPISFDLTYPLNPQEILLPRKYSEYSSRSNNPLCIQCPASFLPESVSDAGVRPESYDLSKRVKGPPPKPGREGVTESCVRGGNDGYEA